MRAQEKVKILADSPLAQAINLAEKSRILAFSITVRETQDAIDQCFNAESKDYKNMLTPKGILQINYSSSVPVITTENWRKP